MLKNTNIFIVNLIYPDNSTTTKKYPVRDTIRDVINDTCKQLDIKRPELFGIAVYEYNEYRFISLKKQLNKVLPSEAIVTGTFCKSNNKGSEENGGKRKPHGMDHALKTCRLYLRVKQFLLDTDSLGGNTLYFYYEQTRLDALKYQNWLQLDGFTDVFTDIAAKTIWLRYKEKWKNIIEKKKASLNYFLPVCEKTEQIWCLLENELKQIDRNYGNNNTVQNCSIIDKLPLSKSDSTSSSSQTIRVEILNEEDVMIMDSNEIIMISVIKDTMKLPYYGIHYYHVSIRNNDNNLTNCKLGVGPFGVTVLVAPFYTTWSESEIITWTNVSDVNHNKNILEITAVKHIDKGTECHQFECLNDKEAKYLFKELKETHTFQTSRKGRASQRKKRNSIGVFNPQESSPSPVSLNSASNSFLVLPNRKESLEST